MRVDVPLELRVIPLVAIGAVAAGTATAISSALTLAVPLVMLITVVLALVVLRRPALGLPIALVLLWTDSTGVASFHYGLPSQAGAIVPVLLMLPVIAGRLRGEKLKLDEGFVWMVIYVLAEVAATVGSAHGSTGVGRIEKTLQEGLVVYLLLVNVVRTPETLRVSVWALIGSSAVMSLITAAQVLSHRYTHTFFGFAAVDHAFLQQKDASFRVSGPVGDPNYYAQVLVTTLPLALVIMLRDSSRRARVWAGIAATVMLLSIVLTYSRGGALALGAVILLMVCFGYVRGRHMAAIACVVLALLVAFPSYGSRLASLSGVGGATASVGSSGTDLSVQQRATENLAAWLAIKEHPVLGLGPGMFPVLYQVYASRVGGAIHLATRHELTQAAAPVDQPASSDQVGEAPQRSVPNLFLSVAADMGVIGLLAFLCLLGFVVTGLLRVRRRWRRSAPQLEPLATGLFLALVGYVVSGFFLALAFERYLWALIALCGATILLSRRGTGTQVAAVPSPPKDLSAPGPLAAEPRAVPREPALPVPLVATVESTERHAQEPSIPARSPHFIRTRRWHGPFVPSRLARRFPLATDEVSRPPTPLCANLLKDERRKHV